MLRQVLALKSRWLGTAFGESITGASTATGVTSAAAPYEWLAAQRLSVNLELSAVAAVLSALAAAISAGIAYQSSRRADRRDRENRIRELSLLANKVVAATIRGDDLSNQLKMAYRTLFTFSGQGGGSSRLQQVYIEEIEKKQKAFGPMQKMARDVLDNKPASLSDEQISERVLQLEGYLAQLDRVREKYHVDLASVESQNQLYRQEQVNIIGPDV